MPKSQRGQTVMITGASAGLGRAIACAFARRGARIGLLARGRAGLDGARADVERLGGRAIALPTDVADPDQVEAAAALVEQEFGPIDVWVNNAMCSVFSPVKQMTPAEFKRVTEVTYLGYVHGTLAALKRMLPRDRGMIVQVGSALAYRSIPLQSAYCAAKHAVAGFTDSLRCELIHDASKVRLTIVQMPAMNTTQFDWVKSRLPRHPQPVPPIYEPEVCAEAVVYASKHYRREWLVGTPTVTAVEGNKVLPGVGDWYLGKQVYDAQQTDRKVAPNRPHNLEQPLDDKIDHGPHGEFNQDARRFSVQWAANQRRTWIGLAGLLGGTYGALRGSGKGAVGGSLFGLIVGTAGAIAAGILQAPPISTVAKPRQSKTKPRSSKPAEKKSKPNASVAGNGTTIARKHASKTPSEVDQEATPPERLSAAERKSLRSKRSRRW